MKRFTIISFILCLSAVSVGQTVDFTINRIFDLNIYKKEDLCAHYSEFANIIFISKKEKECKYRCKLDNISFKADSILLFYNGNYFMLYDYGPIRRYQIKQYFCDKESALKEFELYYNQLVKEFNTNSDIFNYECLSIDNGPDTITVNIQMIDSIYPINIISYTGVIGSLLVRGVILVGLIKEAEKYVIYTYISRD